MTRGGLQLSGLFSFCNGSFTDSIKESSNITDQLMACFQKFFFADINRGFAEVSHIILLYQDNKDLVKLFLQEFLPGERNDHRHPFPVVAIPHTKGLDQVSLFKLYSCEDV